MSDSSNTAKSIYNLQELYKIIQVQQTTINKLNAEVDDLTYYEH